MLLIITVNRPYYEHSMPDFEILHHDWNSKVSDQTNKKIYGFSYVYKKNGCLEKSLLYINQEKLR